MLEFCQTDDRIEGVDCWNKARNRKDVIESQGCTRTGWTGTQLLVASHVKSLTERSIQATRIHSGGCKVSRLVTVQKWQLNDRQSNFNMTASDCSKKTLTENKILWTRRQTWLMIKQLRHYIFRSFERPDKEFQYCRTSKVDDSCSRLTQTWDVSFGIRQRETRPPCLNMSR